MFVTANLDRLIFEAPKPAGADTLTVVSGYVGANPTQRAALLPLRVEVLVGMVSDTGVTPVDHEYFKGLCRASRTLDLRYSLDQEVHSKIYLWSSGSRPLRALVGSANFTWAGLNSPEREFLYEAASSDLGAIHAYCRRLMDTGVSCLADRAASCVRDGPSAPEAFVVGSLGGQTHEVSLLDPKRNEVPASSGLNWGLASANVALGDAYIPVRVSLIRAAPGFIPKKQPGRNTPVEFVWDDGEVMVGFFEGSQPVDGVMYPKQFASTPEKARLGRYLRNRIGVDLSHRVTAADLKAYGRSSISISKLGEERYFIDFSVPKNRP